MKAISKYKIAAASVFIICLLCGCARTEHISDISIAEGMCLDYGESGYRVTIQTLNLAKSGNASEGLSANATMSVYGSGDNISLAIDNAAEGLSKKLFFGQNRLAVLGSGIEGERLEECLDYFIRSSNSQPDIAVCLAEGDPAKVLENDEHDALVPARALTTMLKNGQENGFAAYVTASELANLYLDETSDFYLPVVSAQGDSTYSSKTAVYNGSRLAAVLDKRQTLGFLVMKNKLNGGVITVDDERLGKVAFEIVSSSSKTSAQLKDGTPVFNATIRLQLFINEIENSAGKGITNSDVNRLENEVQEAMERCCRLAFDTCVKNESDCLQIGKHIARRSNAQYKEIKDNWKALLPASTLNIKVKCECEKINDNAKA